MRDQVPQDVASMCDGALDQICATNLIKMGKKLQPGSIFLPESMILQGQNKFG